VKNLILGMVLLLCVVTTQAQNKPQGLTSQPNQTDSALTAETRNVFVNVSENTLKAAREMPDNLYDFTPAEGMRTFRQLVAHIADVQSTLCSNINGSQPKTVEPTEPKEAMVNALAASVTQCQMSFSELSAENANALVRAPVGQVTHLVASCTSSPTRAKSTARCPSIFVSIIYRRRQLMTHPREGLPERFRPNLR